MRSFLIDNVTPRMAVDNAVYPIAPGVASNVNYVIFDVAAGKGGIEYNDRPASGVTITDPSPYQTQLNAWLNAAAADAPPLQLAQAIAAKQAFVDCLYNIKRQLVTTSMFGATWDGSDIGTLALTTTATGFAAGSVQSVVAVVTNNSATSGSHTMIFASTVGIVVGMAVTDLTAALGPDTGTGGPLLVTVASVTATTVVIQSHDTSYGNVAVGFAAGDMMQFAPPSPSPYGGVTLIPKVGAPQSLSGPQINSLLNAIMTSRNSLTSAYSTITSNLAACASIVAVVGFDVTAGWPF